MKFVSASIDMLLLALYIAIFEFLDRFFSRDLKEKLAVEESSKKRILIRQKVRRNRVVLLTCFVIFQIVSEILNIYTAVTQPDNSYAIQSSFWAPGCCLIYLVILKKWKRIKGNISTSDLESFNYNKTEYSLFLRGFDSDDYDKIDELESSKEEYERLSEYWFFKLLSKKYKLPVVSVGMTRELDSPLGAKRIYLDDQEWKIGVRTLMENADRIFILVNDRDSCVWEIVQSKDFLNKTIFIVDDENKYTAAQERVKGLLDLPPVQLSNNKCAIVSLFPKTETVYFENSRMGYAEVLGVKYTTAKTKRKILLYGCLTPLGVLLVFAIVVAIMAHSSVLINQQEVEQIDTVSAFPVDEDDYEIDE